MALSKECKPRKVSWSIFNVVQDWSDPPPPVRKSPRFDFSELGRYGEVKDRACLRRSCPCPGVHRKLGDESAQPLSYCTVLLTPYSETCPNSKPMLDLIILTKSSMGINMGCISGYASECRLLAFLVQMIIFLTIILTILQGPVKLFSWHNDEIRVTLRLFHSMWHSVVLCERQWNNAWICMSLLVLGKCRVAIIASNSFEAVLVFNEIQHA